MVAVDAPATSAWARLQGAPRGAVLLGVLVTHPHPDHRHDSPSCSPARRCRRTHGDVDREIRAKDDASRAQWRPMFGDEWPASATFPNRTVDEESVEVGELRFTAWDFDPCESESETVWLLDGGDTAFVGDLAFNGTHAYLADGHTDAWLGALDRAEEALAGVRTLYVGHGPSAVLAVLADQRRYLLMARESIARVAGPRAADRGRGESRGEPDGALPAERSACCLSAQAPRRSRTSSRSVVMLPLVVASALRRFPQTVMEHQRCSGARVPEEPERAVGIGAVAHACGVLVEQPEDTATASHGTRHRARPRPPPFHWAWWPECADTLPRR